MIKIEISSRKPGRPRAIPEDRIKDVIYLFVNGLGYRAIARELAVKGLLADWSTVRRVIKNYLSNKRTSQTGKNFEF